VILLALTVGSLATLGFTQEPKPMPMDQMKHEMKPGAMMPMDCNAMMQGQDAMKAKMKAMDDQLDKLVADMNAARGSKKVDKMAAVIDELVAQRKQMRDQMQTMMQHMMQHMQSGMMKGMMDSMSSCPMMNKEAAPAAGLEHQH
jgi:TolA-binding protein